jgi:hypothetical protein
LSFDIEQSVGFRFKAINGPNSVSPLCFDTVDTYAQPPGIDPHGSFNHCFDAQLTADFGCLIRGAFEPAHPRIRDHAKTFETGESGYQGIRNAIRQVGISGIGHCPEGKNSH